MILGIICERLGPSPLHNACDSAANHPTVVSHGHRPEKLRNDVWTTHLMVCVSVSGPVSIVVGPINDDPKDHIGQLLTWEHPAFKFASNRIRFVTRTTLHNSPSQHKQCVADRPQNVVG